MAEHEPKQDAEPKQDSEYTLYQPPSSTSFDPERSNPEDRTAVVEPGSELPIPADELYRPAVLRPLDDLRRQVLDGGAGVGGRYDLDELLGQGGMGEVWLARDTRLERDVALKRLRPPEGSELGSRLGPSDVSQLRFLREAQLTGSLEHPNIVPVYDLGVDESGALFFTMKRLGGRSLSELIELNKIGSLLARLDVFRKICDAIAYAHAHAVLHRDLKPDNVMIGEFGEVIVLDWGLSKRFGDAHESVDEVDLDELPRPRSANASASARDSELTQAGSVIGTPVYMAPEQALGKLDELDARTDVYALGALLYTLLTGERPFSGELRVIMDDVRAGRFAPPSTKAKLPRELDAIVCTAMALEPAQRYPSVERLRDDVQAFLEDRPISVLRYSLVRRLGKWAGRNRGLVSAVGLTGAIGVASLIAGGLIYLRDVRAEQARVVQALEQAEDARQTAEQARALAEGAKLRAEQAEHEAAVRAADAQVGLARSLAQQDELIEALDKLDAAAAGYAAAGADPIRATLVRAYIDGQNPAPLYRVTLPKGAVFDAFAGDGRQLAWRVDERVVIEDWVSGQRVFDGVIEGLARAPLAKHSVVATDEGFIAARVTGEELELVALGSSEVIGAAPLAGVEALRVGESGRTALLSYADGIVQAWDVRAHAAAGPRVACGIVLHASHDSGRIVCTPEETPSHIHPDHFEVWDTRTGRHVRDVLGGPTVSLSPDGRYTGHSREHDGIRVYAVDSGKLVWHLDREVLGGYPRFSVDGKRVFTQGGTGRVHWMSIEGELLGRRHPAGRLVAIDAQGGFAVIVDRSEVQIWGTGPGAHAPTLSSEGSVRGFELMRDELLALAVNTKTGALIHDPLTGARVATLELGAAPTAGALDASGRVAAASRPMLHDDGSVEVASVSLFDLHTSAKPAQVLQLGKDAIMDLAFVRGGDELVAGMMSGELVRWDLAENRVVDRIEIGQCPWKLVASPDGELVYVAGRESNEAEVEVWNIATGERVFVSSSNGATYDLALAPSGDRFTTASHRGQPRTFSLTNPEPVTKYPAHPDADMGVAHSPSGALLYSLSYDGKGRFWDVHSQTELLLLPAGVSYPVFSRDGRTVVGYGARFELELGVREAQLELSSPAPPDQSPEQRTLQLLEALSLQHDWSNAARVLAWAEQADFELPHALAGRIMWALGDVAQAAAHFRAALASNEVEGPSLALWLRIAEREL